MTTLMSTTTRTAALAAAILASAFLPYVTGEFWVGIATEAVIFAIAALGLNVLIGHAGLVSVGHAGLFATAAYATALTQTRFGFGFLTSALAAVGITLVVTAVFAIAAVRTTGMYFLMITLAEGMLVWGLAHRWSAVTGGENGAISGVRPDWLALHYEYYWLALAVLVVVAGLVWLYTRSGYGLAVRATRDSATRMTSIGYSPPAQRFGAFLVSGAAMAIAGVLYAGYQPVVGPSAAHLSMSILFMLMVLTGGSGALVGPVVGAVLLTVMRAGVSAETPRWPTVMGVVLIVVVLFAPQGVTGLLQDRLRPRRRPRRRPRHHKQASPELVK